MKYEAIYLGGLKHSLTITHSKKWLMHIMLTLLIQL